MSTAYTSPTPRTYNVISMVSSEHIISRKLREMPLWVKVSSSIIFAIFIGGYMAGEDTRRLDEKYLVGDVRHEMQRIGRAYRL